jgi:PAS domain S-box-containing protein
MEEALCIAEAKLLSILSISADAIISVDPEQRIVVYNEGAQAIFGWSPDEVLGKSLETLIPERFRSTHQQRVAAFAEAIDGARPIGAGELEIVGLRKNGEEFPAEAGVSKLDTCFGRLLTIILRDVSVQKRLEASLRREIRARDELARTVVHDLRNPLSAIVLQTQLMKRGPGAIERRDPAPVERIQRLARQMAQLLDDLLDVSRIEAGRLCLHKVPFPMLKLLAEAVEAAQPQAFVSGIELHADIRNDLPVVTADRLRVFEAVSNLIGNALKFTPRTGTVSIRAEAADAELCVRVTDSGPGVSPEVMNRLFEPFWQAGLGDRRGAGLGLSITKGIVEAHGGRIWVESAPGAGATFSFTLPAS